MTNPPHGDPSAQQHYEPSNWTATQQYPPQPYAPYSAPPPTPPHSPGTAWWRRWWAVGIAGLIIGAGIGGAAAGGSSNTKTVAGPTVQVTTTETATATQSVGGPTVVKTVEHVKTVTARPSAPAAPATTISDGTLVVGTDVRPGVYKTDGHSSLGICSWSRLSSLNTSDIIDGGVVTGPTTIQVEPSDKALMLQGGCRWSKIG